MSPHNEKIRTWMELLLWISDIIVEDQYELILASDLRARSLLYRGKGGMIVRSKSREAIPLYNHVYVGKCLVKFGERGNVLAYVEKNLLQLSSIFHSSGNHFQKHLSVVWH